MTNTRFVALSLATVLTPASNKGTLPAMSHIAGMAMLIAERNDDCNWRFTLESYAIAAGMGEDSLLVWAIGAMPDHGTVLGWKLADGILPPLLDAAADGDPEIGRAFLDRLMKLVTGLSVDLAIPHGGAGAAEFDTVAAARGIMAETMAKAGVESAWATGDTNRLRHHVEAEAIAIWQLWLLEGNGRAAPASEAFDGWLKGRTAL
ncbi:MAG: hypothetical protein ABI240_08930 [Sphingomonas sp.]